MGPETVVTAGQHALEVTIALIAVLLLPALLVGLLVSMIQAATQINEMTLSFISKLLIIFVVLMMAGPWMITLITDFARQLLQSIPYLVG